MTRPCSIRSADCRRGGIGRPGLGAPGGCRTGGDPHHCDRIRLRDRVVLSPGAVELAAGDEVTAGVILVGVDGSEHGDRALTVAAGLAATAGRRLVVVHVAHTPAVAAAAPTVGAGALVVSADELADHCHMYCELALAPTSVAWSFEVRHGSPAAELLRAATEFDAACIVVGRHGHGRLARLLLGSVTDRLVGHADRPVLVVPPSPP